MLGKEVLVTGGGGFIGSRLVFALLGKGAKVRVIDVSYGRLAGKSSPNLELVGTDDDGPHGGFADGELVEKAVDGMDVVYHLAINWDAGTWRHELPLADLFDVNVRGTLNLLEAARAKRVKHFLFASSSAVYGGVDLPVVDEGSLCEPESWDEGPGPAYAILKLTTEKLALMYYHLYGLPVTALRIGYVFDGREVPSGEVHVDDVVEAFLLATLRMKAYGQVFNVTHEPSTSAAKVHRVLAWKANNTLRVLKK